MKVQLATRLDTGLRQRLRVYAAVSGRTVGEVVSAALDGYLPPLAEIVRDADNGPGDAAHEVNEHFPGAMLAARGQVAP